MSARSVAHHPPSPSKPRRPEPRRPEPLRTRAKSTRRWAPRGLIAVLTATVLPLLAAGTAYADAIDISTYDIIDSPASGSGGWAHSYSERFEATGVDPDPAGAGGLLGTYTGGFGTLNDGLISDQSDLTHLFFTGARANPVITLHLASTAFIDDIEIYGGDIQLNVIPGALSQVTVEIGGLSLPVSPEPFGLSGPVNDRVTLAGTPLSGIATDTIVLRNTASSFFDQFSITEVRINGRPLATPPLAVGIDILPGQKTATIKARDDDPISVAVLSTATFNAVTAVNKASLKFGRTGQEPSLKSCGKPRDVNRDKRPDLICAFKGRVANFRLGDTTGFLTGLTTAGKALQGMDTVRVRR